MQARYPQNIVLLIEGLVGPLDDDDVNDWYDRSFDFLATL